ncbi:MAG: hypothetical protein EXR75_15605 [Myxococcales bacterium]|nr:hypothetical protein [Myxococcales bacterium]
MPGAGAIANSGERACSAAVLPIAAGAGDPDRALRYLSWMTPDPPKLDADSEYRVSCAVVATLDRDAQRVMHLLGQQKDAVPIADSMDVLGSVFRANAFELMGNHAAATQILGELPDARMLGLVRGRLPAGPRGPYQASFT